MPFRRQPWKSLKTRRFSMRRVRRLLEVLPDTPRKFFPAHGKTFLIGGLAVGVIGWAALARASGDPRAGVQRRVDALRARLGITAPVTVTLVDADARTVSVRRDGASGGFALAVEREFLMKLTAEQIEAMLAHELGHVWIYTHHPYLQTEQLANRVAMRVVTREQLLEVYRILWGEDAVGSLEAFLGVEATITTQ